MGYVNKPHMSRWIGGMYVAVTIFMLVVFFGLCALFYVDQVELTVRVAVLGIFCILALFMAWITLSFYDTEYTIEQGVLRSRSPFTKIELRLKDIEKAERLLVPVHFRVGSSLYCGWFYVPNVGWVRSIITNLRDAVMITTTDNRRYLVTPSEPERFIRKLMG